MSPFRIFLVLAIVLCPFHYLIAQAEEETYTVYLYKQDFGGNEPDAPGIPLEGIPEVVGYQYSVSIQPSPNHYALRKSDWGNIGAWHIISDHTFPNDRFRGYALFVDANYTHGIIYQKDLDVLCDGINMAFSIHIINLDSWNYYQHLLSRGMRLVCPDLLFRITDMETGEILMSSTTGAVDFDRDDPNPNADQLPEWKKYTKQLKIPAGVSRIRFEIISNTNSGLGADMAIDDIEISAILPSVTVDPIHACDGQDLTLTPHVTNNGTFSEPLQWQWEKQTSQTEWTVVGRDSLLTIPKVQGSDAGSYRVKVTGNSGHFDLLGCYSARTVTVPLPERKDTFLQQRICRGERYDFNGQQIEEAGDYSYLTQSLLTGCDSTVHLHLDVDELKDTTLTVRICRGERYDFNGQQIEEAGDYSYLTQSLLTGCDSTVHLHLDVDEPKDTTLTVRICRGERYDFNGQQIEEAGDYSYLTQSLLTGCDSTVHLHLDVDELKDTTLTVHLCSGDYYDFNGQQIEEAGDYSYHTQSLLTGCDSTVYLHLNVHQEEETEVTVQMPQKGFYEWEGDEYRVPGTYHKKLQSMWGCDSLVTLTIEPNPEVEIVLPEGFSPNGDGINETFVIQGIENYPENRIRIFNRWGNKIYEASPYHNDWDGRNHEGGHIGSAELPVGTYYYLLWLHGSGSPKKGYIYLNR